MLYAKVNEPGIQMHQVINKIVRGQVFEKKEYVGPPSLLLKKTSSEVFCYS